ncbi:hypothetical protein pb186bvf_006927 [Paramecium bursaria]
MKQKQYQKKLQLRLSGFEPDPTGWSLNCATSTPQTQNQKFMINYIYLQKRIILQNGQTNSLFLELNKKLLI